MGATENQSEIPCYLVNKCDYDYINITIIKEDIIITI